MWAAFILAWAAALSAAPVVAVASASATPPVSVVAAPLPPAAPPATVAATAAVGSPSSTPVPKPTTAMAEPAVAAAEPELDDEANYWGDELLAQEMEDALLNDEAAMMAAEGEMDDWEKFEDDEAEELMHDMAELLDDGDVADDVPASSEDGHARVVDEHDDVPANDVADAHHALKEGEAHHRRPAVEPDHEAVERAGLDGGEIGSMSSESEMLTFTVTPSGKTQTQCFYEDLSKPVPRALPTWYFVYDEAEWEGDVSMTLVDATGEAVERQIAKKKGSYILRAEKSAAYQVRCVFDAAPHVGALLSALPRRFLRLRVSALSRVLVRVSHPTPARTLPRPHARTRRSTRSASCTTDRCLRGARTGQSRSPSSS